MPLEWPANAPEAFPADRLSYLLLWISSEVGGSLEASFPTGVLCLLPSAQSLGAGFDASEPGSSGGALAGQLTAATPTQMMPLPRMPMSPMESRKMNMP